MTVPFRLGFGNASFIFAARRDSAIGVNEIVDRFHSQILFFIVRSDPPARAESMGTCNEQNGDPRKRIAENCFDQAATCLPQDTKTVVVAEESEKVNDCMLNVVDHVYLRMLGSGLDRSLRR